MTIYAQRSPGSWTITFDIGRTSGKRRQRRETVHGTRRDAERLLARRLSEFDQRRLPARTSITFDDLADAFLLERGQRVAPTTLEVYARHLHLHIRPLLGGLLIDRISTHDVETVLSTVTNHSRTRRKGGSLVHGTLHNILITVRACLQYAVRNDWLVRNVATAVQLPRHDSDREPVLFDGTMISRLFRALRESSIADEVLFALGTGVRRGELCGLLWGDVDLARGWYTVRRNAVHVRQGVCYRSPKTKNSRRTDALPNGLRQLLIQHKINQQSLFTAIGLGQVAEKSFVFTREDGSPWKPNELSRQFSRFVRKHGLGPLRLHDLRHGHASVAFAAGVPLHTISDGLGHSSDAITAKIYVHLLAEAREEKARRVDDYLQNAIALEEGDAHRLHQ